MKLQNNRTTVSFPREKLNRHKAEGQGTTVTVKL